MNCRLTAFVKYEVSSVEEVREKERNSTKRDDTTSNIELSTKMTDH